LARRYAVECGDTAFSAPFKRLLLRAIAIGRRRDTLKDITLKHYLADLDRRLNRIMAAVPLGEAGRKLLKRIAANRAHLFVFITNRDVPYTNNVSERHLRPSVIFRKVTNGFRCEWGAETYAAALSSAPQRPTALRCSMFCASCLPQTFPSSYRSDRSEQLPIQRQRPRRKLNAAEEQQDQPGEQQGRESRREFTLVDLGFGMSTGTLQADSVNHDDEQD
jgi:hypothetical protein